MARQAIRHTMGREPHSAAVTWTDASDDAELLHATAQDPEAFGALYRRHERAIGGYLMRRVRDPELAADLTAETFAAALIGADRYRGEGPVLAWLYGIAQRVLARSLERAQVEDRARRRLGMRVEITDDVREHFERLAGDEQAAIILEGLDPDQAGAVRARVIDEVDYDEIARRLRVSPSVVRKRVSRGLAVLRSRRNLT
jgi:RNA polymerase sigma factor (sigma-70 family)